MSSKVTFFKHTAAVSAIFLLGNAVICLPEKNADEFTIAAFMVSTVPLAAGCFLMWIILGFISENEQRNIAGRVLAGTFYTAVSVFAAFCAADTFGDFTDFVFKVILPRSPRFFICLLFLVTVAYFSAKRQENILKFCALNFVLVTAVILFFFISASDKYNLRNIYVFRLPRLDEFVGQLKPYIINPVLPSLLLPVYTFFCFGKKKIRANLTGVLTGQLLLGLCLLTAVLLFGPDFAGRLEFPFSSAVSTVTVGRLFTRLDGFSYFVYFVSAAIRITVCSFVAFMSLKKINRILKKT